MATSDSGSKPPPRHCVQAAHHGIIATGVMRRELRGAEKRTKGCGEEKTLYFGATVQSSDPGIVLWDTNTA